MKTKAEAKEVTFDPKLIDELLSGKSGAGAMQGLIEQVTKTLLEER